MDSKKQNIYIYEHIRTNSFILATRHNIYKKINHPVFWPPFVLLIISLIISQAAKQTFIEKINHFNSWILNHFDWLFNYTSFTMVILCAIIYFSRIGKIKIGGKSAEPLLSKWRWFSIILCTTIAVGILFWGASEPLYHLSSPPKGRSGDPGFAMSAIFMHWSITPYAIYTIPALLFALGFYNYDRDYSLGAMLFPIMGFHLNRWIIVALDVICLFALAAGMSAVLGVGMLTLAGGTTSFLDTVDKSVLLGIICIAIVATFTVSAASGLLKGIRILSGINVSIFIIISLFVFAAGPTSFIIDNAWGGIKHFAVNFVPHSLSTGAYGDKKWMHSWTTFYWANWMAWAPITALFLGRISYGYTVRQFILFNWLIPAFFGILWMSIFSGFSIFLEVHKQAGLLPILYEKGPDVIIYQIFEHLPFAGLLSGLFLFTVFLSYVTAADSNTEAMSSISTRGINPTTTNAPKSIKFSWGILIGLVAWVMVSYSGVDGVRILSNLGGLPSLFLMVVLCLLTIKLLLSKSD
ncbi:MAG: BCCT family transporter [Cytophagales bacterium]|nr:BCCT family transporter [Cytophagales bacterium]